MNENEERLREALTKIAYDVVVSGDTMSCEECLEEYPFAWMVEVCLHDRPAPKPRVLCLSCSIGVQAEFMAFIIRTQSSQIHDK